MAERDNDNYLKVRDGKVSEEFFFNIKTFGPAYRAALRRMAALRQGSTPVLSVFAHPSTRNRALLPPDVQCVGGCAICAPRLAGLDPDADDDN
jgi:hypothetical protein